MRPACLVLLFLLAVPAATRANTPFATPATGGEPGQLCRAAIAAAEREAGLPPRLLAAMGRVESGRRDPDTGRLHPWPWTINAEGRGNFFPTKAAAVAAARSLQAQGVRSFDVGCMQINMRHHPDAFADLEEAFDPAANARYAARFLKELQATRGDWMRSASHYHSQTPELAEAYRARVAAALEAEQAATPPAATMLASATATLPPRPPAAVASPPPVPAFTGGGGFMLSNRTEQAAGGGGRGLDAYRTMPIPVAGRGPALAAAGLAAVGRGPAPTAFSWMR